MSIGNRSVPWVAIIQEGMHTEKYLVWANSEESATRKAMKQFKREFRDGYDLRMTHGTETVLVRRSHKQEVAKWQGKTIRK